MTSAPKSGGERPLLTPRELWVIYVVAVLCLVGLGMVTAKRLGYWPGPKVTVVTVPAQSELTDLNAAPWWELANLPGIGEVRAKAIVKAREARKGFRSVDELDQIPGIPSPVAKELKSMVQVGDYGGESGE